MQLMVVLALIRASKALTSASCKVGWPKTPTQMRFRNERLVYALSSQEKGLAQR